MRTKTNIEKLLETSEKFARTAKETALYVRTYVPHLNMCIARVRSSPRLFAYNFVTFGTSFVSSHEYAYI